MFGGRPKPLFGGRGTLHLECKVFSTCGSNACKQQGSPEKGGLSLSLSLSCTGHFLSNSRLKPLKYVWWLEAPRCCREKYFRERRSKDFGISLLKSDLSGQKAKH